MFGDESILFTNGTEGRLRRKATDPAWGHDMLRHFCEIFNEVSLSFVDWAMRHTQLWLL